MRLENNWKYKTLQNLLKTKIIDDADSYSSYLVSQHNKLMKKNLIEFTVEDVRLMTGQQTGLNYLIPLSIELLQKDILIEGDFYPGDLLEKVLNIDIDFWIDNKPLWIKIDNLIKPQLEEIKELKISIDKFYNAY